MAMNLVDSLLPPVVVPSIVAVRIRVQYHVPYQRMLKGKLQSSTIAPKHMASCRIIVIIAVLMFGINVWPDCGGSDIPKTVNI